MHTTVAVEIFERKYDRECIDKAPKNYNGNWRFRIIMRTALTHQKNVIHCLHDVNSEMAQPSILHRIFEKNPSKFCIKRYAKIERL